MAKRKSRAARAAKTSRDHSSGSEVPVQEAIITPTQSKKELMKYTKQSEPLPDQPKPLTEFTCFGRLPGELRAMIWKAAEFPRIFDFDMGYYGPYWTSEKFPSKTSSSMPIRSLLYVNKEARGETLRHSSISTLRLRSHDTPPRWCRDENKSNWELPSREVLSWEVPFNSNIDIFHVPRSASDWWFAHLQDLGNFERTNNYNQLEKVRRLAIGNDHAYHIFSDTLASWFPNLVEITLYDAERGKLEIGKFKFLSYEEFMNQPDIRENMIKQYSPYEFEKLVSFWTRAGNWQMGPPAVRFAVPLIEFTTYGHTEHDDEEMPSKVIKEDERRLIYG